ncbi:MAG TPA: SemiSWEET transporter [Chitinophagaceae bacterium]|jgi:MtN3 and saliva related transmembrane protein|nr:SemiSWEET transporter [Chitinophagaceae bacterium]
MDMTKWIGIVAGALTATSLLPQLIKTLREKKADEISIVMLLVLFSGVALWIVYGVRRDDLPIIIANSVSLLINICMLVLRLKYKDGKGAAQPTH